MPQIQHIRLGGRRGPTKNQIMGQAIAGAGQTLGQGIAVFGEQKARTEELEVKKAELAERKAERDAKEAKGDVERWSKWVTAQKDEGRYNQAVNVGRQLGYDKTAPELFERIANPDIKFGKSDEENMNRMLNDYDALTESTSADINKDTIYDKTTGMIKQYARNPKEARSMRQQLNYQIGLTYGLEPPEEKTDWYAQYGEEKPPLPGQPGVSAGLVAPGAVARSPKEQLAEQGITNIGQLAQRAGADVAGIPGEPAPGLGPVAPVAGSDINRGIQDVGSEASLYGDINPFGVPALPPRPAQKRPEPTGPRKVIGDARRAYLEKSLAEYEGRRAPGGVDLSSIAAGATDDEFVGPPAPATVPDGDAVGASPSPVELVEKKSEAVLMAALKDPVYKQLHKSIQAQRGKGDSWTEIMSRIKNAMPGIYEQMIGGQG